MDLALAIDIGGTTVAAGVVDTSGRLHERATIPTRTPGADEGEVLLARIVELVERFGPFERFRCCGIGSAGPMTRGGTLISPLNIEAFRSFPLAARLAEATGLPCRLDNDAKALALAEGWVGAAVGVDDYLAMVVSTGVGGGIVLNGSLLEGSAGNAGHIGQMVVDWPGRRIDGHVAGTLEAEASGTAIAAHSGCPAPEATTATVARAATYVGRAAGSVVNLLDLDLVVVAGSVALGLGEPFFAAAQREMDRICTLDFSRGVRIQPAGCGHDGPLIGAAAVGFKAVGVDLDQPMARP
jgi:glucokinase